MGDIRWGYAINQWRTMEVDLARLDQMESAFKVISVCGFDAIEITDTALGGDTIPAYFGSARKFLDFLRDCGVQQVCSYFSGLGHTDPAKPGDHDRMVESAKRTAHGLAELQGSRLVVRPMGPYWKEAPVTPEKVGIVAEGLNRVGAATRALGVETSVHIDFLCALRVAEHLEPLLDATDPSCVGLTLDTADFTIAGVDPVEIYSRHHARINHVNFKDAVTTDTLDEYKDPNAEMEYWPTPIVLAGAKRNIDRWYYEMGTPGGLVDFPALLALMKQHDYDGWVVVESDQSPHVEESVMLNGWYKKRLLAGLP